MIKCQVTLMKAVPEKGLRRAIHSHDHSDSRSNDGEQS